MELDQIKNNAQSLVEELNWLSEVINRRFRIAFSEESDQGGIFDLELPVIDKDDSPYASVIRKYNMNAEERLLLILALCPYIRPQALDIFFTKNSAFDRPFTEFGGVKGSQHVGFLPTGETVLFIAAGSDLERRIKLSRLFEPDHFFTTANILRFELNAATDPPLSSSISLTSEFLNFFTSGEMNKPDFSFSFPAKLLQSPLDWSDLVLPSHVLDDIHEIRSWVLHHDTIMEEWDLKRKIQPGFKTLFHGPPGTGKTLTASLLGKATAHDVYRIDLSMIVSKYIGETEKNLSSVFSMAENKDWILFFDEADALFGKRTITGSSHDSYANQEVSYLLQRIEDFSGLVILATNFKANINDAFARRFHSMIYFPMPDVEERLLLWQNAFSGNVNVDDKVNFNDLAEKFELSGGAITNILRYSTLKAISKGSNKVMSEDILSGIRREYSKEGQLTR